jgi:GntR family transcriptional regulator
MDIQRNSEIPLHRQLKDAIRLRIDSGEWPRGWKVPSEPELCRSLSISRGTVRQAISALIREGLLESRRGDGTYVTGPAVEQHLMGFYSFAREARERGIELTSEVLDWAVVPAYSGLSQRLGVEPGAKVLRVTRLRLLEGEPILLETCSMPHDLVSALSEEDFTRGAIYDALEKKCHLRVASAKETFEAVVMGDYESGLLGVPVHSPAFSVERLAYAAGDKPVELRHSIIRGDRCRYHIELK